MTNSQLIKIDIYSLLKKLDEIGCHYRIDRTRTDSILIVVTFVGFRLEISTFPDESVEVSRFYGDESVEGGWELVEDAIFSDFGPSFVK
jgi:hypothetical protein